MIRLVQTSMKSKRICTLEPQDHHQHPVALAMLAIWSSIQTSILFIWILNCITIAITTGTTTTDPSSSLFYAIVTTTNDTVDNVDNDNVSGHHQFQDGNITTTTAAATAKQLDNKFNKNVNLTSSDSMMNLFELMMPQYLVSNSPSQLDPDPHFHHHHHHGHRHHGHHHHGQHGQPDFRFAPALIDPEPLLVSTEPQRPQNPEVQLIIDYYNQLYSNDPRRTTFPFTTPSLEQFTPTVSYSLDEFSSFMPSYQPLFTTTNETPCSLEKSAENYAKTKTKRPTYKQHTDDDVTDCSGGDGRKDDDNDDDDHQNETSEENPDDDDDTPLPYDPFEYLNQYRKTIPQGGDTNHNDGEADSKPDDGGGAAEEEETNNDNDQPSKSTDGEENGGDNKVEVEEVDKTSGSGTNGDNNSNDDNNSLNTGGEEEPESEPEPETNDSKTEPNLIELDTKTARKNEQNDWEPKDDDDFDQDESSSLPIRMVKGLNNTTSVPVVSGQNDQENRTRIIRSKRSLSTVIDQLRMVNDQFNQIDAMDPMYDLHPSSSRSMLPPNLMPYARPRPRPTSPSLSMSAANLLGSPNYFDYWNQASIHNSRANAHWKHHLRHHPGQGIRFSNQPHRNPYQASKAKSMFLKNQAYPYMKLNRQEFYPANVMMTDRRPVPTVYSELDEIHNQQKAIHDSFRSGELLLPRGGGYEDSDNFQPPQEQFPFQYPPGPMTTEYVENAPDPDTPTGEEEYGNEDDETIIPQTPPEPNYYDENMSFDGQVTNEDYPPPEPLMVRGKPYAYKPHANNGYFNARLPVPVFPRKSHKTYKLMQSNHQLF